MFETFRRDHDIRTLQSTGAQYAITATRVLTKYVEMQLSTKPTPATEPVAHLQSLARTLKDLCVQYKQALRPLEKVEMFLRSLATPDRDNASPQNYCGETSQRKQSLNMEQAATSLGAGNAGSWKDVHKGNDGKAQPNVNGAEEETDLNSVGGQSGTYAIPEWCSMDETESLDEWEKLLA